MPDRGLVADLARHIGQTVTIFTTSGGESGRGFTGVLASVNCDFVRLITQIGPAPGCALGNCCEEERRTDRNTGRNRNTERNRRTDRIDCTGRNGLGSIVDIPVNRIAALVRNSEGGGF